MQGRLLNNVELIEGSLQDTNKPDFSDAEYPVIGGVIAVDAIVVSN